MIALRTIAVMLLFTLGAGGCVATTTSSTTWTAQPPPAYGRPGYVQWVREVVQREQGDPAGGALLGAVIGGMVGGRGPGMVIGAIGGAAIGAAASQGGRETRNYEVAVQFNDGARLTFMYGGYSPFQPGQPVMLTPDGLVSM